MLKLLSLALLAGSVLNWPGLWGPAPKGSVAGRLSSAVAVDTLWSRPVSGGYSEVAIAGGRAFTLELRGADDYLVALDATTGRDAWTLRLGPTYRGHDGSDTGPIGTPAVDGNDVFAVGPHGVLVAADAASGRERWRHDLVAISTRRRLPGGSRRRRSSRRACHCPDGWREESRSACVRSRARNARMERPPRSATGLHVGRGCRDRRRPADPGRIAQSALRCNASRRPRAVEHGARRSRRRS